MDLFSNSSRSRPDGNSGSLIWRICGAKPLPPLKPVAGAGIPISFQPEVPPPPRPARSEAVPAPGQLWSQTQPGLEPDGVDPEITPGELWSRSVIEAPSEGATAPQGGAAPEAREPALPPVEAEPESGAADVTAGVEADEIRDLTRAVAPASPPVQRPIEVAMPLRKDHISLADRHPEDFDANPVLPVLAAAGDTAGGSTLERDAGIWLAGSGSDLLESCTKAEQRKHGALGLTVLVPASFALVASAYAVATLTPNPWIIIPLSLLWAGIILVIDRSLLATYRSSLSPKWKAAQFGIRMTVAILMGLTISHPITLLLFKDTIAAQIESEREQDVVRVRESAAEDKAAIQKKIQASQARIQEFRNAYQASFQPSFLPDEAPAFAGLGETGQLTQADRERLAERLAVTAKPFEEELANLDKEKGTLLESQRTFKAEIIHWQAEYEAELDGTRSGKAGIGPRARSIERDQLAWRRKEAERISRELERVDNTRFEVEAAMQRAGDQVRAEFADLAAERERKRRGEMERLAALRAQAQETQLASFVAGGNDVRDQIQAQIDSGLADIQLFREELAAVAIAEQERIAEVRAAPRRDLLTQTLAMHHLFAGASEGGRFALLAYLVLAGLFLTVDTIPILVKFTSRSGEYDEKLDQFHHEAELDKVECRRALLRQRQQETMQKIDGTREIFEKEAALLESRLELIERQIQVAHREAAFRKEFGFAQRLPRAS